MPSPPWRSSRSSPRLWLYDRARPGAEIPLQLPEGAAATKARDAVQSLGYTFSGSQQDVEFHRTIDLKDVVTIAGLPVAREAIHDGVVAQWAVGLTKTTSPGALANDVLANVTDARPLEGEFAVRMDPRGEVSGVLTGVSHHRDPGARSRTRHRPRARDAEAPVQGGRVGIPVGIHHARVPGQHRGDDLAQPDTSLRTYRTAAG